MRIHEALRRSREETRRCTVNPSMAPLCTDQGMATVAFVNPAQSVGGVLYLGLGRRRHLRLRAMQLTPRVFPEQRRRSRRVKREPVGEIGHARLHGSRRCDRVQVFQHTGSAPRCPRAARMDRHDRSRSPSLPPRGRCDACVGARGSETARSSPSSLPSPSRRFDRRRRTSNCCIATVYEGDRWARGTEGGGRARRARMVPGTRRDHAGVAHCGE